MEEYKKIYMEMEPKYVAEKAAKDRRAKIAEEVQAKADRVSAIAARASDLAAKLSAKNTACGADAGSSDCTTKTAAWKTVDDAEKKDQQLNLELAA